jgi:UDP-glucose 4-epimerase
MLTARSHGLVFNIGSTEEVSILELAHRVRTMADSSSEVSFLSYEDAYEVGFEDMARRIPGYLSHSGASRLGANPDA